MARFHDIFVQILSPQLVLGNQDYARCDPTFRRQVVSAISTFQVISGACVLLPRKNGCLYKLGRHGFEMLLSEVPICFRDQHASV
jgi:hypothetical protein